MYKRIKVVIVLFLLYSGTTSCEKYDDYITDYKFSAVYFATQKPLRTVVADEDMQFKVGVALGGKRKNTQEEWARFVIDPSLLSDKEIVGNKDFKLLPEEYYTLSDNELMVIPEGEFIGDVTVDLNKSAFINDTLAHLNTYALPLRVVETSVDSILSGKFDQQGNQLVPAKDYTVVVVKYISPLQGIYYHKGVQKELDSTGSVKDTIVYSEENLSQNDTWELTTVAKNTVRTSGIGAKENYSLYLTKNEDNSVTIEEFSNEVDLLEKEGSTFEEEGINTFYLNYTYEIGDAVFRVTDTLIQRQPAQAELRFEEW